MVAEKRELRLQARELRRNGMSVNDIQKMLGVAKSSVSNWVRDVPLTEYQVEKLQEKRRHYRAQNNGAQANRKLGLERREQYQLAGRARAKEMCPLHLAGCMLYWAEGAKARNKAHFANSDPNMQLLYVRFLREEMGVVNDDIRLYVHCHTTDVEEQHRIEQYWLYLLKLPESCLRKTYVKKGSQLVYKHLVNGVCTLIVNKSEVVQHIFGAIQEYGGFENPEWLF